MRAPAARREWTRRWWSAASEQYELVTSLAVIGELQSGPPDKHSEWLGLIKDLLIAEKLLPTHIARMRLQQHNRPVLTFHLARAPLDARLLAGKCLLTGFGSSIHVGTGIERVVQQGKDAPTS